MNNLFEVWRHYNKSQLETSKGPLVQQWLQRIEKLADGWNGETYPSGEYWKYLNFGDLKTTKLVPAESQGTNDQWTNEDCVSIQLSDFFGMTSIRYSQLPLGIKIFNHKDILESAELSQKFQQATAQLPKQENNPFAEMPLSFFGLGIFVIVEKGTQLDKPIKLTLDLNQMTHKDSLANYSIRVHMESESRAEFYIETQGELFSGLSNTRLDFLLDPSAQLKVYTKERGGPQSRSLQHLFANVDRDAELKVFDTTLPGFWSRHNSTVSLLAPNASTQLKGIYLNNNDYFCDHHTEIQHLKEHTLSSQNYKGVLADRAKAVFNGKVFIEKFARQSQSEQMNKNLMLSKKAEVDTKPELQIYNDDVKASHGATIGQIDDEQLFYLMSRGYKSEQAWNALARAFIYDLFEDEASFAVNFYEQDIAFALHQFEGLSNVF